MLDQIMFDCARQRDPRKRGKAILEVAAWIENDARGARFQAGPDGFEYTFEFWCESLGVDEGAMRRHLGGKLREWERREEANETIDRRGAS